MLNLEDVLAGYNYQPHESASKRHIHLPCTACCRCARGQGSSSDFFLRGRAVFVGEGEDDVALL